MTARAVGGSLPVRRSAPLAYGGLSKSRRRQIPERPGSDIRSALRARDTR